jgi:hypothetical protein
MAEWYYAQNDEQLGPVTATALKEMAQQGRLRPEDLIWREGMQRWAPANKVRGLFSASEIDKRSPEAPPVAAGAAALAEAMLAGGAAEALVDEEETAIDALPLANQEESKLQLPLLGAPDNAAAARGDSNELVVFEPAGPPARAAASPAPRRVVEAEVEPDDRASRTSDTKRLRVDVPGSSAQRMSRSVALFLQTFLWVSCLLVIVAGGAIYVATLVMTRDAAMRLAASGVYATCVVAAYFLASGTQRLCHVLSQWFVADVEVKQRRNVRDRNWKRFQ